MKIKLLLLILVLIIISFFFPGYHFFQGFSSSKNSESLLKTKISQDLKDWTLLMYFDADCNLEAEALDDFNEMEMEGSDENINVIVQIDRNPDYDDSNGDWTDARRYYVKKDYDQSRIRSDVVENLGEINMGSPETLESFIQWGKTNYPAEKYALVLWDHGSGVVFENSIGGICWDDSNGYDYLTLSEISSVLSTPTNKIDLLGLDACLMGATEIHYELKDFVSVIIASEELEPGDGYPYDDIIKFLKSNPTATPEQLGVEIVNTYNSFYSDPQYDVTQAAVSSLSNEFILALNNFIDDLNNNLEEQKNFIQSARLDSLEFDEESYVDLFDLVQNVQVYCSGDIDNTAQTLLESISDVVLEEQHSNSRAEAHGLSIYFPKSYFMYSTSYETSKFAQDLLWDEFLRTYYLGGEEIFDDQFEENDQLSSASILAQGSYYNLILNGTDLDFFKVLVQEGNYFEVEIHFNHEQGDLDLFLLDVDGNLVDSSRSETDNEIVDYYISHNGYYAIVVDSYNNYTYQPYDLIIKGGLDDNFEQNDNWEEAQSIETNTLYTNLVCTDSDFFSFTASEGLLINVTIEFRYAHGDLDLYLWDGSEPEVIHSSYTATDNENILFYADYTGLYIVEVYNYESNDNYALKIEVKDIDDQFETSGGHPNNNIINWGSPLNYGTYENLVCLNPDCYTISLSANIWINITLIFAHDEGDIDLYLLDYDNNTIASSVSYTDNEYIYQEIERSGTYIIVVHDYEINLKYSLIISETTTVWDDEFENNDWFDEATELQINVPHENLSALDWDAFYFEGQEDSDYTITLEYTVINGDLDLYIIEYDIDTDEAYIIESSSSLENQEQIEITPNRSEMIYILVYPNEINLNYSLTIVGASDQIIGTNTSPFLLLILTIVLLATVIYIRKISFRENNHIEDN